MSKRTSSVRPISVKKGEEEEGILEYLRQAISWREDKVASQEQSENRAWNVAKAAILVAVLSIVTVILLLPLKQTKVEVLIADRSTGNVEQMTTLEEAVQSMDEVFIKSFITKFIRAREGYNPTMNEDDYYTAAAFMSPQMQADWNEQWKPENPTNLMRRYGDKVKRVEIATITPNKRDDGTVQSATIWYGTALYLNAVDAAAKRNPIEVEYRVANMSFGFVPVSKSEKERRINPVGFQIDAYRTDPDVGGGQARPGATETVPIQ